MAKEYKCTMTNPADFQPPITRWVFLNYNDLPEISAMPEGYVIRGNQLVFDFLNNLIKKYPYITFSGRGRTIAYGGKQMDINNAILLAAGISGENNLFTTNDFQYINIDNGGSFDVPYRWNRLSTGSSAIIIFVFNDDYTEGYTLFIDYVSGSQDRIGAVVDSNQPNTWWSYEYVTKANLISPEYQIDNIRNAVNGVTPIIIDPNNPYQPGGTSTTGGGNGTFDDTSEPVDFAPLPSLTAINSGFVGLYAPTLSQLQGLSNYLWNESFNLDQLKKLFADPMDLLISLTIVPLSPPITVQENIKVGFISTGLPMNKVEQQFITYDFGSLDIKPYFDSALDYSPFTKISIYLPYIGLRQLNVDEIMNTTIHIQYNIDLFTGSCVAEIKVADSVLYTFNGNLASSIPLTAGNFSNFLSATMNVAATIGLAATTGGAVGATSIASSAANLISSAKPNIEHTGSISSTTGYLSNKTPYLVYEIPRQSIADKYQDYVGFPSNITSKLSDLSGYTEIESIHLENIPATMNELTEIESLLKQGVIL